MRRSQVAVVTLTLVLATGSAGGPFDGTSGNAGGEANGNLAQEAGGQELRGALTRIAAYLDQHCGTHS